MNALVTHAEHPVSDLERMAKAFAVSKLFGIQNTEQALALCLIAQAEGRHPASAAADYHIINGRPSKKADAMLRDFLSGGGKVEWHKLTDEVADATFSHPAGGSARIDWTLARAKTAGLTTPMWSKYPRQMLRSRVVSEGVRTVYPMATSGMYVPEEIQDFEPSRSAPVDEDARAEAAENVTPTRQTAKPADATKPTMPAECGALLTEMIGAKTVAALDAWANANLAKIDKLSPKGQDALQLAYSRRRDDLEAAADEPEATPFDDEERAA
jgi:hypothetical protein